MNNNKPFFEDDVETTKTNEEKQPEQKIDEQNFSTMDEDALEPSNVLNLPSNGKTGYASQVFYRDIMAGDEEILASATGDTYSKTLNGVLKSILNDFKDYHKMTVADRDYCLIWLWSNNYQSVKKTIITCPHCGKEYEHTFDMLNLPYTEIKDNYQHGFEIPIKKTGGNIIVRLNTVGDEIKAEEFVRLQKKDKNIKDEDIITYDRAMLYLSITITGAENLSIEQKAKWIRTNVSSRELGYAKQFHRYFSYGIDTVVETRCTHCEGEAKARIPFQAEDVLYPELQSDFEDFLRFSKDT